MIPLEIPEIVQDLVLFLVRLVLFIAFLNEAKVKFKNLKKFAKSHDLSPAMAGFVATVELLAALSMLTGFLAQWAGMGIVLLMIGTLQLNWFKWHSKYWAQKGGWEYDVLMLVLAAIVVVFGPGIIGISGLI